MRLTPRGHKVAEFGVGLMIGLLFSGILFIGSARAGDRPCGLGGSNNENRRLASCLAREAGLRPPGGPAKARSVGNCESGFYAKAYNPAGPYVGIYQLLHAEFRPFWHQAPERFKDEFREYDYGIRSARGNIIAALAHAADHGWGAWSCA